MTTTLFVVGILIGIALDLGLGHFLKLLEEDDPEISSQVATPSEIHIGRHGMYFLGTFKFMLYYIVPRTYEIWNLSARSERFADRFRIAVIVGIPLTYLLPGWAVIRIWGW